MVVNASYEHKKLKLAKFVGKTPKYKFIKFAGNHISLQNYLNNQDFLVINLIVVFNY